MRPIETELALLHIPQLAALATSAKPAWLWGSDGSRLIWANAVGAAIFGAANADAAAKLEFRTDSAAATQVTRLAATLSTAGQERLERLRGFGARFGALTCICSRIGLFDGSAAILIAAAEPAGPSLPLAERARRLFSDDAASAIFAPEGRLLHTGSSALAQLNGATTFAALGVDAVAAAALASGHARGTAFLGQHNAEVTVFRLGEGESRVLVLTLPSGEWRTEAEPAAQPDAAAAPVDTEAAADASAAAAPAERSHPLRFVWQMDAAGRFVVGSDEFIELVGPRTIAACGRLWSEIAAELKLDPQHEVARAMATHETWSAIEVAWPIDDSSERVVVELSGLPVFDRNRIFGGYRGFGVCRDVARINDLLRARHSRPIGFMPPAKGDVGETAAAAGGVPVEEEPTQGIGAETSPPSEPAAPLAAAANVVPFRTAGAAEPKIPSLSPGERNAFRELAQELTARLCGQFEQPADAATAHLTTGAAQVGMAALVWAEAVAAVNPEGSRIPTEIASAVISGQPEERDRALAAALETAQEQIQELKAGLGHTARHQAQQAAAAKADFVAKVSHEIRTPLNSMIGFAEVIMAERFGAIGNERYREYLKDIHTAGTQLVSLLNDLVDLTKVESGRLDLNFASLDLNDLTRQCVAVMQPQANRARIIIRSALAADLSQVVADPRSVRQIVLNLLSHAIKLTGPGGQVIVSTAATDGGEAVLRVRDTGAGMRETEVDAALDPFRDTDTAANWGIAGSGLGLPLTKALAEANHATFRIKSAPNAGTLVEITFPPTPLAAQ